MPSSNPITNTSTSTSTSSDRDTRPRSLLTSYFPAVSIWTHHNLTPAGVNSLSGAAAGIISGVLTCPLDVIKTKLQAQSQMHGDIPKHARPPPLYKGLIGTARVIMRQEGLAGFYRGVKPMVLGYIPTWAIYMPVYDTTRQFLYDHGYGTHERDKWFARLYASVTAGFCGNIVTSPIWVIKTRLMSMSAPTSEAGSSTSPSSRPAKGTSYHYTGTLDAARQMYKEGGPKVFYAGLVPGLLGLSHVAIQFPLYEYFKTAFTGSEMGSSSPSPTSSSALGILAAGFISKLCATIATYPHEVLRTRQQTQIRGSVSSTPHMTTSKLVGSTDGMVWKPKYKGLVGTFGTILREEGWRAFYNGMGTNMIRAVPAAMTTMLAYESIKGAFGRLQEEGREVEGEREAGVGW